MDGEAGGAQFEGPKRVYLMKISKKLNYILTCMFSDGNANPTQFCFLTDVLKHVFLKVDNFFNFQLIVLKFRPVMSPTKLYSLSNFGWGQNVPEVT